MQRKIFSITLLLTLVLAGPAPAFDKPSEQHMMEMLKISGAMDVLMPMMDQLVTSIETDLKKQQPNLSKKAYTVITSELRTGTNQMIKELLIHQMNYFSQHLTSQEVDELITMYSSPVWKKYMAVNKQYVQDEYAQLIQTHVPEMTRKMMKRIFDRLTAEGYFKDTEAGI